MAYFDDKQKKLIKSWHNLSLGSNDFYMKFMSEWIAFNAICYNLYYKQATIERANIERQKSKRAIRVLNEVKSIPQKIHVEETTLNIDSEKWSLDLKWSKNLESPPRLFISVSTNYTEDIIFNEFVREFEEWYRGNLDDSNQLFEDLKASLQKDYKSNSRHYVVNMAKSKLYDKSGNVDEMAKKNIIVLCENNELKTIKNVLYQIRCNIFHGEKTPGNVNDDRIVKSALPLLSYTVEHLIDRHKINEEYPS
ncbi:hypothetical protein [Persicitalea sp.]|uniref:hypothetical protein n=1 Tax=Persicitalea sp. TaxID=3100273 RepID=UPI0035930100